MGERRPTIARLYASFQNPRPINLFQHFWQDGGGGIRTHEPLRVSGFQDRRDRPLCHPSSTVRASGLWGGNGSPQAHGTRVQSAKTLSRNGIFAELST